MNHHVAPSAVRPAAQVQQTRLRGVDPSPPFTLLLDHSWEWKYDRVTQSGVWLPGITCARHTVGVNGNRDGDPSASIAHHQHHKGCVVVDPHDQRLGEFVDFVGRGPVSGRGGAGFWHGFRWVSWTATQGGRRWVATPDPGMTTRFRQHLASLYQLDIDASVVRQVETRINRRIDRLRDRVAEGYLSKANAEELIADYDAELAAARAAYDELTAAPAEPVKPAPRKRAASGGRASRAKGDA